MSERLGSSSEFTITHEQADDNPELRPAYRLERLEARNRGESLWEIKDFELPHDKDSMSWHYYQNHRLMGRVEGSDKDGWHAYGPSMEADDHRLHHINTEPIESLHEAQKSLTRYLEEPH